MPSGLLSRRGVISAVRFDPLYPASLGGLVLWLRSDSLAGADASAVSSWVSREGSAYDFAQADAAKQPLLYTSTAAHLIGGQPGVHFDGGDLLRYPGAIGSELLGHAIAVIRPHTMTASGGPAFISSADEASTTRLLRFGTAGGSTRQIEVQQRSADTIDRVFGSALTNDASVALEWSSSGTAYALRVNGAVQSLTVSSGADAGDWFGDTANRDNMVLGALKTTSEGNFLNGDLAEVIRTSQAMTAGERTSLNAYLTGRYGITMT